jgi:DNA-binding HxlR family transcriptional regulator
MDTSSFYPKRTPFVLCWPWLAEIYQWKPIILHYLSEAPRRSGELGRLIPQASGKMLTRQLRELEADKIIRRKIYRQVPPKVEYILTPLGESLRSVMLAMCAWGEANSQCEDVEGNEERVGQNLAGMRLRTSPDSVFQAANPGTASDVNREGPSTSRKT